MLKPVGTIAVVGCSREPTKDAHSVPAFLKKIGYEIVPVNPYAVEIFGSTCYDDLREANRYVESSLELVDVFRPVSKIPEIFKETLTVGADVFWVQLGIEFKGATRKAGNQGVTIIENRCIYREYRKNFGDTLRSNL